MIPPCAEDPREWDRLTGMEWKAGREPHEALQALWDEAKARFCWGCPVLDGCAAQGARDPYGIYGGLDQWERHLIRKREHSRIHREREKARKLAAKAIETVHLPEPEPAPAEPEIRPLPPLPFPERDPTEGNAWVRFERRLGPAWYQATAPDGRLLMKIGHRASGTLRWCRPEEVDLRAPVTPVMREPRKDANGKVTNERRRDRRRKPAKPEGKAA